MKIGIFTTQADAFGQGSGIYMRRIVDAIFEAHPERDITLVHREAGDPSFYAGRSELVLEGSPHEWLAPLRAFDLIHFATLGHDSPLLALPARKVITIHGGAELHTLPRSYRALKAWYKKRFLRPRMLRRMDAVFTVSETSKRLLMHKQGVEERKIVLTPNGTSPHYRVLPGFSPDSIRSRYGIRGDFIYHVSHYMERKNPKGIVDAVALLIAEFGFAGQLVISGKDWEGVLRHPAAQRLQREGRLLLTGYTPEQDVVELLNAARCFLFPSLYEGFGIPNLEAMACGCPVVTSNTPAIVEVVADAALVVDAPRDPRAIARRLDALLSSESLRSELAAKGLARSELYSWDASARKVLLTYDALLA